MKITAVDAFPFSMPHLEKGWHVSLGSIEGAQVDIVRLETDEGLTGYGAAPTGATLISGETHESVCHVIRTVLGPPLIGRDPFDLERILHDVERRIKWNSRAKTGIDTALYDLLGKILGLPAYQLLGGAFRTEIPVLRLVGMSKPDQMAADAKRLTDQGFRYFKIKVGSNPAVDVDRVAAVRAACGPDVHLTIDANQAYTPKVAIDTLRRMEAYGLELAEQPVREDDIEGLALVRRSVNVLVEADESVRTIGDAMRVIKAEAADYILIKLGKLGGIHASKKLAAVCEAANVKCRVGANPGGRLIEAANLHFIASTPNIDYACEVGEFARVSGDPTGDLEAEGGVMRVPTRPGLGLPVRVGAEAVVA